MSAITVTKAEIIQYLFELNDLGLNKKEIREVVEMFFAEISMVLAGRSAVQLVNFGNFKLRDKKERLGRNPKTKKAVPIKARRVVTFRVASALKNRLAKVVL